MIELLIVLGLLLNGNFSQGLNHWNADNGWYAANSMAVLRVDNRAGAATQSAVMCSDAYALGARRSLVGSADVFTRNNNGYVFVGVRWYDKNGKRLWDEAWASNEGKPLHVWQHLSFQTRAPSAAQKVSFCFFAGGYIGKIYRAKVDNASLK